MSAWESRRDMWALDVSTAQKRARLTVGALAVTIGLHVYQSVVSGWQLSLVGGVASGQTSQSSLELSDTLFQLGALAQVAVLLVTGVLFLMWLAKTVGATRAMITLPLRWTPSQAVWGFFIPFVNFTRPYHVARDVHDRLDPEGVPEPAPRPRPDKASGYRSVPVERAPLPAALPPASIGLWWGLYIGGGIIERLAGQVHGQSVEAFTSARKGSILSDVVEIAGALLAIRVVRAIDARLAERHRRLHHASDEELDALGLE